MIISISKGAPRFIKKPADSIAIQEKSVKYEVIVDALPKAMLSLLLDGKEIKTKESAKIDTDAKTGSNFFAINKVSADHVGTYKIKASNKIGEMEHSFELKVFGNTMLLNI